MNEDLRPELSTKEIKAMDFHLYYLKEVYQLSKSIAREVEELINCKNKLERLDGEKLSHKFIDKVIDHFQTRYKLRSELEAILLEDGEHARDTVLEVLENPHYKKSYDQKAT